VNNIARRRCEKLIALAKKNWVEDEKLALRYVTLARKIAMRHRLKLGSKDFCRKCNTPFNSKTMKKRLVKGFVVLECLNCGSKRRTTKYAK